MSRRRSQLRASRCAERAAAGAARDFRDCDRPRRPAPASRGRALSRSFGRAASRDDAIELFAVLADDGDGVLGCRCAR